MERVKKGNCRREEENLKWKGENGVRYEMSREPTTEICLGCTKMEIFLGSFLTSPTFDCTPGYVSEVITWTSTSSPSYHQCCFVNLV